MNERRRLCVFVSGKVFVVVVGASRRRPGEGVGNAVLVAALVVAGGNVAEVDAAVEGVIDSEVGRVRVHHPGFGAVGGVFREVDEVLPRFHDGTFLLVVVTKVVEVQAYIGQVVDTIVSERIAIDSQVPKQPPDGIPSHLRSVTSKDFFFLRFFFGELLLDIRCFRFALVMIGPVAFFADVDAGVVVGRFDLVECLGVVASVLRGVCCVEKFYDEPDSTEHISDRGWSGRPRRRRRPAPSPRREPLHQTYTPSACRTKTST